MGEPGGGGTYVPLVVFVSFKLCTLYMPYLLQTKTSMDLSHYRWHKALNIKGAFQVGNVLSIYPPNERKQRVRVAPCLLVLPSAPLYRTQMM